VINRHYFNHDELMALLSIPKDEKIIAVGWIRRDGELWIRTETKSDELKGGNNEF